MAWICSRDIRTRYPELPVLILSMHDESIYAERGLRAGAQGYIMKQEATEKVLVALRRILSREIYVSERIANRMLQRYIGSRGSSRPASIADLTDRELEVFRLIGEGPLHTANRRRTAHQREDGRILSGTHQRKVVTSQRPRTGAACHSVERQAKKPPENCRSSHLSAPQKPVFALSVAGKSLSQLYYFVVTQKKAPPACGGPSNLLMLAIQ